MSGNTEIPRDSVNIRKPMPNIQDVKKTHENTRKQLANFHEMKKEAMNEQKKSRTTNIKKNL